MADIGLNQNFKVGNREFHIQTVTNVEEGFVRSEIFEQAGGARRRARAAAERRIPDRASLHRVRAAVRGAVGDGHLLGQARSQGLHGGRDRSPHRAAPVAGSALLQRRNARRGVCLAEFPARPGRAAARQAVVARAPPGRRALGCEVVRPAP